MDLVGTSRYGGPNIRSRTIGDVTLRAYDRFAVLWRGVMGVQPVAFARVRAWIH